MVRDRLSVRTEGLRFAYRDGRFRLGAVDVELPAGRMTAVVGPNGAGKSTLVRLLAGLLRPDEGSVFVGENLLRKLGPRRRAQQIAFLPQHPQAPPDLKAGDVVMLGRFPHRRFGFLDAPSDLEVVRNAMRATETHEFADRPLDTLSGGEQQRVHLAAALAQKPRILLLDEPTAALDPCHQLAGFSLLKRLSVEDEITVVLATHDLNLAGRYCDRMLLIDRGRVAAWASPAEVLRPEVLGPVYHVEFASLTDPAGDTPWIVPIGGRRSSEP